MNGQPKGGSAARRRAATAAVCTVLFASVGGVLLATPANAGILGATDVCATPTTAVDTTGAGTGTIDLGGSSTGLTLGVSCVTSVAIGDPSAQSNSTARERSASAADPSTTTDPATASDAAVAAEGAASGTIPTPTDSGSTTASAGDASISTASASATGTAELATLSILRSSNTVYPVKDGFRDSVRFAVRAMSVSGALVPVVGSAVLTKDGTAVDTWHIDGSSTRITWDGRVKHAIETGLYSLKVSAWSLDGTTRTGRALVRVGSKHLVKHVMTVRSDVGARSVAADLPHSLLKAYANGEITCRLVTVARVHGPAKLVFGGSGVTRNVALKNGSHSTKPLPVPQGFSHVSITHDWAKGDAHLTSLKAIWTYYTLT